MSATRIEIIDEGTVAYGESFYRVCVMPQGTVVEVNVIEHMDGMGRVRRGHWRLIYSGKTKDAVIKAFTGREKEGAR